MKTGTIKYSQEFRTLEGNYWLGIEMEYDMNTENPQDVFSRARSEVNKFANVNSQVNLDGSFNPYSVTASWVNPAIQVKEPEIGLKPEDILSCNDLKVLETYKFLVKMDKELERAYILRYDQLTAKTINNDH